MDPESNPTSDVNYDEIVVSKNFGKREYIQIPQGSGHGGGDKLLKDHVFILIYSDPLKQASGERRSIGMSSWNCCQKKHKTKPVMIKDLTTINHR